MEDKPIRWRQEAYSLRPITHDAAGNPLNGEPMAIQTIRSVQERQIDDTTWEAIALHEDERFVPLPHVED